MEIIKELNLTKPVHMAGDAQGVWIGDPRTKSITRYEPSNGEPIGGKFFIPGQATGLAILPGYVVVALDDGSLYWYSINLNQGCQQTITKSGPLELQINGSRVWALDTKGKRFLQVTSSGVIKQILDVDVVSWTASEKGVYWIDQGGIVWFSDGIQLHASTRELPPLWREGGALVTCSNVLWISIVDSLGMISLKTLEAGRALPTLEGPIDHLVCDHDHRIWGGGKSLFVLDPAVDINIRKIDIALESPISGLVCAGAYVWGLETDAPIMHILQIP